ncbi:hypothetical protein DICSQDRAFT_170753 [Dichomitus squalens LYAD-421 SS1]|uniref:CCR4-Not complex component Not1 C-terminal domain-containing protein n=1 Tax=Dichomitus squalens (strain LYAD-421) TaxID=732165 RepID=R7SY63_DICSQ|nr:uncharacterized protein DICSQDRAFT_170753 [Dichomitus squalens LYAD-421 SS1]EJF60893.1 hypothetical protein DICSQDRAFT_170753 [Dichomitus squalens LYAD-421 SS1]
MQPITPACLDAVNTGESSTPLDASQVPPTTAQPTTTKKPRAPRKTPQWPPPADLRGAKWAYARNWYADTNGSQAEFEQHYKSMTPSIEETPAASQQSDSYDLLYAAFPPHQFQSMVANACIPGFCLPLKSPARLSDWFSPHIATHATPSVLKLVLLLQPTYLPGFVFSWMSLISHRLFMPKLLPSKNREVGSGPVD